MSTSWVEWEQGERASDARVRAREGVRAGGVVGRGGEGGADAGGEGGARERVRADGDGVAHARRRRGGGFSEWECVGFVFRRGWIDAGGTVGGDDDGRERGLRRRGFFASRRRRRRRAKDARDRGRGGDDRGQRREGGGDAEGDDDATGGNVDEQAKSWQGKGETRREPAGRRGRRRGGEETRGEKARPDTT